MNGRPINCTNSSSPAPAPVQAPEGSSLHVASSLDGPWLPVLAGAPPSCNNPAPARHPNGTWFLVCDSRTLFRLDDGPASGAPIGAWSEVSQLVPGPGALRGNYEDALLFFDAEDPPMWHALFHIWTSDTNITTCATTTVSGLAFSRDGISWQFSQQQPYGNEVLFTDGSRMLLPTRERPKIFFDERRRPVRLVNGACGGVSSCLPNWCSRCKQLAWDYTLVQPIAAS